MSAPINDGGPAFPVDISCYNGDRSRLYGMSLRDYFAAAALQGMLADHTCLGTYAQVAEGAYGYADAMIAQREGKP